MPGLDALTACDRLLRAASPLVPADMRADWLREWRAELHYDVARRTRRGHTGRLATLALAGRCLGAFVHAGWLRWDRWRIEMLLQDLRYAVRTLIKRPGFTTIAVLTLALGIGGNAAIFSAVRAVLLRPLPFPQAGELVQVFTTNVTAPDLAGGSASAPDFTDWRRESRSFTDLAAISAGSFALTAVGPAEQIPGANVTGGFFNVLGVPALYGRTLLPEDDPIGGPDVAVISHALWMRRFGGDPHVVGRTVTFAATPYRIVGVMPRGFAFPLGSEVWVPLRFTEQQLNTQRGAHYLDVIGRRRPDVSLEQARDEMRAMAIRLADTYPKTNANARIAVHDIREALVGDVKPALQMLAGAVGFVLLIVCVNVASLILTRALGRTREMAVRTALGAGRARLVRGVLVESLVLAAAGAAGGLLLAVWASQGIAALQRGLGIPLLDETRVDATVVLFTLGLSAASALLFGTLPAWHASSLGDVARRIREESGTATGDRQRQRIRGGLIIVETALAVVLLVGAGLLLRTFIQLASVELGFDPRHVQTFNISLPQQQYPQPADRAAFVQTLLDRIRQRPGVEAAGAIFGLPLTDFGYTISMSTLDGRRLDDATQDRLSLKVRVVSADYFRAMAIPIVRGRPITADDRLGAPLAIVINETAARGLWPDADPLGHEFTLGTRMGQGGANAGGTVVGVARDVRDFGPAVTTSPTVYLSHAQFPMAFVTVAVRVTGQPSALVEPLRTLVGDLDPNLPMFRVRTLEQIASDAVAQPRAYLLLVAVFALVAVLLAAIGIYGVLMHAVAQRTREIGIRLALGAARAEVVALVVRQAAGLAGAGLVLGLALAAGATRWFRQLLFGVEPTDMTTFALVAAGLFVVALVASSIPARRAARVNPVTALRYE